MLFKYSLCDKKTTRNENILHAFDCEYIQEKERILLKRVKLQKRLITKFEN